jgi:2-oxo-4-hydroxy-4-carboxy-5-ureidoimidazoline decarboxylase
MLDSLIVQSGPEICFMETPSSNAILARWNEVDAEAAAQEVLPCCGSRAWAQGLAARRPFAAAQPFFEASDAVCAGLAEDDWREAFDSHPRIGQQHSRAATAESLAWSSEEQQAATSASGSNQEAARLALAEGNRQYEERFGRIFIVCAAGKSASEILAILNTRMQHDAATEMLEAAEQQRQITQLRLRRWLGVS